MTETKDTTLPNGGSEVGFDRAVELFLSPESWRSARGEFTGELVLCEERVTERRQLTVIRRTQEVCVVHIGFGQEPPGKVSVRSEVVEGWHSVDSQDVRVHYPRAFFVPLAEAVTAVKAFVRGEPMPGEIEWRTLDHRELRFEETWRRPGSDETREE